MVLKVDGMLNRAEVLQLSNAETAVSASYVVDQHIKAIGIAAQTIKFAVTFRESGESTLRCLKLGAAAKGHDILEKTIKASSLQAGYGEHAAEQFCLLKHAAIDGYVGHWDERHQLLGIYMGPEAQAANKRSALAHALRCTDTNKPFYPLDMNNLEASLSTLKEVPNWESLPYTGDYDLHDMISYDGHRGPVVAGSEEERKIIAALNAAVGRADPKLRPVASRHKNVVRHGPQQSFVAHMLYNEGRRMMSAAVAKPSFPLAMCDRGEWSIIKSQQELQSYYDRNKMALKVTWQSSDVHFEDHQDGNVSLRRGSVMSMSTVSGADPSAGVARQLGNLARPERLMLDIVDITERSEEPTERSQDPEQHARTH